MTDKQPPITVYIENAHNPGIGGFTIPLPTTAEALAPWFAAIGAHSRNSQDIAIVEVRSPITEFSRALRGTDVTLEEYNYFAAKVSCLCDHDMSVFLAALDSGHFNGSITRIINVLENVERFELMPVFSEEGYGEHLLDTEKDNMAHIFDRLIESKDEDERTFAEYVQRLEAHVDARAYGMDAAEKENGVFTDHGYLAKYGEFKEVYRGPQDIPDEYRLFQDEESPVRDPVKDDLPIGISDCVPGGLDGDLKGKVVAIRLDSLRSEYHASRHQIMLATSGFGCAPDARGKAVYGTNLHTGVHERWNRPDILGVIKDSVLPEWAREKLAALQAPAEKESVIAKIRSARETEKTDPPLERKTNTQDKSGPEL